MESERTIRANQMIHDAYESRSLRGIEANVLLDQLFELTVDECENLYPQLSTKELIMISYACQRRYRNEYFGLVMNFDNAFKQIKEFKLDDEQIKKKLTRCLWILQCNVQRDMGRTDAQKKLGWLCYYDDKELRNEDVALEYYTALADDGDAEAMFALGDIYRDIDMKCHNAETSMSWYEKSAEAEWIPAKRYLSAYYYHRKNLEDIGKAYHYALSAAMDGDVYSMYLLANILLSGFGVEQDIAEGEKWLHKAFETDKATNSIPVLVERIHGCKLVNDEWMSQFNETNRKQECWNTIKKLQSIVFKKELTDQQIRELGASCAYLNTDCFPHEERNYKVGLRMLNYLGKACALIDEEYSKCISSFKIPDPDKNKFYFETRRAIEKKTLLYLWRIRAEAGDAKAAMNIARQLINGYGGTYDFERGLKWYELAAYWGEKDAELKVYTETRDRHAFERSIQLAMRSMCNGNAIVMGEFARDCFNGKRSIPQNKELALYWGRKSVMGGGTYFLRKQVRLVDEEPKRKYEIERQKNSSIDLQIVEYKVAKVPPVSGLDVNVAKQILLHYGLESRILPCFIMDKPSDIVIDYALVDEKVGLFTNLAFVIDGVRRSEPPRDSYEATHVVPWFRDLDKDVSIFLASGFEDENIKNNSILCIQIRLNRGQYTFERKRSFAKAWYYHNLELDDWTAVGGDCCDKCKEPCDRMYCPWYNAHVPIEGHDLLEIQPYYCLDRNWAVVEICLPIDYHLEYMKKNHGEQTFVRIGYKFEDKDGRKTEGDLNFFAGTFSEQP